ncbi:hypothetical protein [Kitasatospora griseola]|uniref:hypothetical protein n=1 Tax=Kitasatospora griseola TaxID=2064 RepID=UPI0038288716
MLAEGLAGAEAAAVGHRVDGQRGGLQQLARPEPPPPESRTERDITLMSLSEPLWRESIEVSHLSDRPFQVDDSDIRDTFGLKPSTLREALAM